jgi:hypothetical protein
VQLYIDGDLTYYKVLIAEGTKLVAGATAATCEAAGMTAVCPGASNCAYNSATCLVTPISENGCNYMDSLAQLICNTGATRCPDFAGVAVFMHGYANSDYLVLKNTVGYQQGEKYIAGTGDQSYYAYCVVCSSCQGEHKYVKSYKNNNHMLTSLGWSEWSSCGANCKRTRTRTCSGGNECASSRTSDEQCQNGLCDPGDFYIRYKL